MRVLIFGFMLVISVPGVAGLIRARQRLPQTLQSESSPSSQRQSKTDSQSRPQESPTPDDVVRISTNLVQIDAVVTGKDGKLVSDLTAEDFEIYEEGKRQPITNFSFIATGPSALTTPASAAAAPTSSATAKKAIAPPPPIRPRADQVRRTMAVLVDDDRHLSFSSIFAVRLTLTKFLAEQLEPHDLVGIFRPGQQGNGVFQQFTSDRNQLALVIRRLEWHPTIKTAFDVFEPTRREFIAGFGPGRGDQPGKPESGNLLSPLDPAFRSAMRESYFGLNDNDPPTAAMLRFLIHDMRTLPGRKSIVVFSDELALGPRAAFIADYATRSGITIYTVHARGLVNTDYIGADEDVTSADVTAGRTDQIRNSRAHKFWMEQAGLSYLAEETGGTFTHNNNDLGKGLRAALEESRGYYLIGYRPAEETFKRGLRFRKIEVKVKRPGFRVRARKGFLGVTDETVLLPTRSHTGDSLYAALASPLSNVDVRTRLTPMFGYDEHTGYFIRTLLYLEPRDLTFTDEPNESKKLIIDVAAVTYDQKGAIYDEFTRSYTAHFDRDQFAFVQQNGLIYSADVAVKKPGPHAFRIAVRDQVSQRIGSAGQFITIPDLSNKNNFALSAIMLGEASENRTVATLPPAATIEAALAPVPAVTSSAVRRFQPGMILAYANLIYNARSDKKDGAHVTTQLRLFRDGKEVFTSQETPLDTSGQLTPERLLNRGRLHLPTQAAAGEYALQIIVNDDAPGEKRRTTSQWVDFEVVQ
ncbi:MAG: VWA domain-containing protein [Pyrinomonadaceae bacterium]